MPQKAAVLLYSPGSDTFLEDMTRMPAGYSIREGAKSYEGLTKSAEEPDNLWAFS